MRWIVQRWIVQRWFRQHQHADHSSRNQHYDGKGCPWCERQPYSSAQCSGGAIKKAAEFIKKVNSAALSAE